MIEFIIHCLYCDHQEKKTYYLPPDKKDLYCKICKETKLIKLKKVEKKDVFGYNYKDPYLKDVIPDGDEDDDDPSAGWPD